jgi:DNA-binding IclR family transcriptional regulator
LSGHETGGARPLCRGHHGHSPEGEKLAVRPFQETGQTTHLGILDGNEGVYIEKIEGKLAAIAYSRIGRRLPVHATAIGKVLLAWLGTRT